MWDIGRVTDANYADYIRGETLTCKHENEKAFFTITKMLPQKVLTKSHILHSSRSWDADQPMESRCTYTHIIYTYK